MNIIKLSAINSTNDYLKELLVAGQAENFTVVVTQNQTGGRGQMGTQWKAEPGKNLTFSLLIKDLQAGVSGIFLLNVAVAVSVAQALVSSGIPGISIKWPNDILADNKKLGGILIENTIKSNGQVHSIIGIGINVNQADFTGLPKATSLAVAAGHDFDSDALMMDILQQININTTRPAANEQLLWQEYHTLLFKKGVPMPFAKNGNNFMGIIQCVNTNGSLVVLHEDNTTGEYGIKELQLLY